MQLAQKARLRSPIGIGTPLKRRRSTVGSLLIQHLQAKTFTLVEISPFQSNLKTESNLLTGPRGMRDKVIKPKKLLTEKLPSVIALHETVPIVRNRLELVQNHGQQPPAAAESGPAERKRRLPAAGTPLKAPDCPTANRCWTNHPYSRQ